MTENNEVDLGSTGSAGVSRRTVTKAMAWAVPAIAIAAPVPAFAASGNPPVVLAGQAFKWPGNSCTNTPGVPNFLDGNKAYLFTFRVTNNTGKTIYIYGATITTTTGLTFTVEGATPAFGTPIAPGGVVDLRVWASSSDSGNLVFCASAQIFWGHNFPGPDPDNHPSVKLSWQVAGTPTTNSEGYGGCAIPPFVSIGDPAPPCAV